MVDLILLVGSRLSIYSCAFLRVINIAFMSKISCCSSNQMSTRKIGFYDFQTVDIGMKFSLQVVQNCVGKRQLFNKTHIADCSISLFPLSGKFSPNQMLTIMIEDTADYRLSIEIPLQYVYGKILTRNMIIVILRLHCIPDSIFFHYSLKNSTKK